MPAAASFEDIYKTSSSLSPSVGSGAASYPHHLPDYMAMYLENGRQPTSVAAGEQQLTGAGAKAAPGAGKQQPQVTGGTTSETHIGPATTPAAAAVAPASKLSRNHTATTMNSTNQNTANNNKSQLKTYQQQQQTDCDISRPQLGQLRQQLYGRRQSDFYLGQKCNKPALDYYNDYYYYYGFDLDDEDQDGDCEADDLDQEPQEYEHEPLSRSYTSNNKYSTFNLNTMISFDDEEQQLVCLKQSKDSFLASTMTPPTHQHYLTLEELKMAHSSCWLCGCNWQQDHVSLDCQECGGYALTRPCPNCDGKCKQIWERNIAGTHDHHRASWVGQCKLQQAKDSVVVGAGAANTCSTQATAGGAAVASAEQQQDNKRLSAEAGNGLLNSVILHKPSLASSCCSSQTSSAASSDCESDCGAPISCTASQQKVKSQQQLSASGHHVAQATGGGQIKGRTQQQSQQSTMTTSPIAGDMCVCTKPRAL